MPVVGSRLKQPRHVGRCFCGAGIVRADASAEAPGRRCDHPTTAATAGIAIVRVVGQIRRAASSRTPPTARGRIGRGRRPIPTTNLVSVHRCSSTWVKRVAYALAGLVMLLVPSSASAHRSATRSETRALVYHSSGRYYGGIKVSESASVPLRCFIADISTAAKGSRWGAWAFSPYARQVGHAQQCRTGDGIAIAHKIGNRWYVYWEGSSGYPPTHDKKIGSWTLKAVPRAVARI